MMKRNNCCIDLLQSGCEVYYTQSVAVSSIFGSRHLDCHAVGSEIRCSVSADLNDVDVLC